MKGKILTLLLVTLLSTLLFAPLVRAQIADIGIYGYVDKIQYKYGDTGQLKIWVVNEGTKDLTMRNITVIYPWNYILPWEGNETIKELTEIEVDENKTFSLEFTVPTDRGIIASTSITVRVYTDELGYRSASISTSIENPPWNMEIEGMDNLVTLITVQIILVIIAAIIIAAAVFLSGHRPGVTWQKEE